MGKKSSSSGPTQTSQEYGKAMLKQQQLAEEAQKWYESEMFPWLKEATEQANKDAQADSAQAAQDYAYWRKYYGDWADFYSGMSGDLYNRYKENYVPVEDALIDQASNYDENAYGERQAGYSVGDLATQYNTNRGGLETAMQQSGYDPTSGHYQAEMARLNDQEAYARASAAYTAQEEARNLGWTRQYYAAQQGQQYINNALNTAANATQTAQQAGGMMSSALGNASNYSQNALNQISSLAQLGVNNYSSLSSAWQGYGNLASGLGQSNTNSYQRNQQTSANSYAAGANTMGGVAAAGIAAGTKYAMS